MRIRTFIGIFAAAAILICLALILAPAWYLAETREYRDVIIPADGYQLHGYLSQSERVDADWILFIHGNRKPGQGHPLYIQIRNNLPRQFSVLALDLRGFGQSADVNLAQASEILDRSADLLAATRFLGEHYNITEDRIILIGHSLGAAQVFHMAQNHRYRLVVPIGVGYWDGVLQDRTKMLGYINRFESNTGVRLTEEIIRQQGSNFTAKALLSSCPRSPVWIVFASRDEARRPLYPDYQRMRESCGEDLQWSTVPFADHVYGTELTWVPKPLQTIYSRLMVSLLKWRLTDILNRFDS